MRHATSTAFVLCVALASVAVGAAEAQRAQCGRERWRVKTLMDADAGRVGGEAEPTTIAALASMPKPGEARPHDRRLPLELRRFRVRATLTGRREQSDGDIHLLLADPARSGAQLIGEIPDSACALESRHASDYAEARRVLDRLADGVELDVEGIAFWDDEHNVLGAAPNGLELHPVIRIVPVLTRSDLLREEVGADPPDTTAVRVWLNRASRVYHCPGSAYYGNTARGEFLPETEAVRRGARPAGGRPCAKRGGAPPT